MERTKARMISVPPIVGVPALAVWLAGPSLRIGWLICMAARERIRYGPRRKEIRSAIRAAKAARKVI